MNKGGKITERQEIKEKIGRIADLIEIIEKLGTQDIRATITSLLTLNNPVAVAMASDLERRLLHRELEELILNRGRAKEAGRIDDFLRLTLGILSNVHEALKFKDLDSSELNRLKNIMIYTLSDFLEVFDSLSSLDENFVKQLLLEMDAIKILPSILEQANSLGVDTADSLSRWQIISRYIFGESN